MKKLIKIKRIMKKQKQRRKFKKQIKIKRTTKKHKNKI